MAFPQKLSCDNVVEIAKGFFTGTTVKALASTFMVSRITITRILDRSTYKDCETLNIMVKALGTLAYAEKVDIQMDANKRKATGRSRI